MGGGALRRRGSAPRVRRTRAWSLRGTARHARLYGRCAPAAGLPTRDVVRAPPTAAACVARPFRRSHATFVRAGRAWSPQASPSLPPRPSRALAQPEKKRMAGRRGCISERGGPRRPAPLEWWHGGASLGSPCASTPARPPRLLPLLRAAAARAAHGVGLPTLHGWNFWPPPAPRRARIHGERHGSPPLASAASRRGGSIRRDGLVW